MADRRSAIRAFACVLQFAAAWSVATEEGGAEAPQSGKDEPSVELREVKFRTGELCSTTPYVDGVPHGVRKIYSKLGALREEIPLEKGVLHGTWTSYHEDGSRACTMEYAQGIPTGPERVYRPDGSLRSERPVVGGLRNGEEKRYDAAGQVEEIVPWVNGVVEGILKTFSKEKPASECEYVGGARHGEERILGADGKVAERQYWIDGQRIATKAEFERRFAAAPRPVQDATDTPGIRCERVVGRHQSDAEIFIELPSDCSELRLESSAPSQIDFPVDRIAGSAVLPLIVGSDASTISRDIILRGILPSGDVYFEHGMTLLVIDFRGR